MATVTTKKELANAVKRGDSQIIIEGDLANHVIRIKLLGPVAWGVATVALGSAIYLYIATPAATATTAGTGGTISFGAASTSAAAAATVLGFKATATAVGIGIAAGGFGALTKLRDKYRISDKSKNRVVLQKKVHVK